MPSRTRSPLTRRASQEAPTHGPSPSQRSPAEAYSTLSSARRTLRYFHAPRALRDGPAEVQLLLQREHAQLPVQVLTFHSITSSRRSTAPSGRSALPFLELTALPASALPEIAPISS